MVSRQMPSVALDRAEDIHAFQLEAHRTVDWIAWYLEHSETFPVVSRVRPGEIRSQFASEPPDDGVGTRGALEEVRERILPGITHWNSPEFMAYFAISGSPPGILAELVCAAFNVNGMLWETSPAATELEQLTLDWLRQMLGLPQALFGLIYDTASISTLCAVAAARERALPDVRGHGLSGGPQLTLYCSAEAHSVVDKAAMVLGIGHDQVRKVTTDNELRMNPMQLAQMVRADRTAGYLPFCVVATVGTTSTTSIDPVSDIAYVCEESSLWLHVDAAYGGAAAIVPEMRWVLQGCDRADSLCLNPHKWLLTPVDLSVLYTRDPQQLRAAFSLVKPYLETGHDEEVTNLMDYGPQLGRRFRALKLWLVLRAYGVNGLQSVIRRHLQLAAELEEWVQTAPAFELMAPRHFSTVCFRAIPSREAETACEALNRAILNRVNRSGDAYISHTQIQGRYALRVAIGHMWTERNHVERLQELLTEAAAAVT